MRNAINRAADRATVGLGSVTALLLSVVVVIRLGSDRSALQVLGHVAARDQREAEMNVLSDYSEATELPVAPAPPAPPVEAATRAG